MNPLATPAPLPPPTRDRLWWQVAAIALVLPLGWGLALPRFMLLDPIAHQAATTSGAVAGWVVALLAGLAAARRLRGGPRPSFAFRAAMDVALLCTAAAIVAWTVSQIDPRVPYIESFSILCMQVASGWAAALLVYVWCGSRLRFAGGALRDDRLPGVRMVFAVSALMLGLFTAVALGVGSSGRAAGSLDRQRAWKLADTADLLAAAIRRTRSEEQRAGLLRLLDHDPGAAAALLPAGESPPAVRAARDAAATPYGMVVLGATGRIHIVRRDTPHGTLWLSAVANVRPPVRAPDDAPAMLILALLVLGAPLAAMAVGHDLHERLRDVTRDLQAMGPAGAGVGPAGVPVASNDETGDLTVELNATIGRFAEENRVLAAELDAAAASDRARNRFLAAASHELRTPLTSIIGFCHLLERGTLTEAQREDVRVIAAASDQLLGHVDEILDLSSIESGRELPLRREPVDLAELARRILAEQADRIAAGVSVSVSAAPDAPRALADPQRVRQVLENLIGNALKFTGAGFVEVAVAAGEPLDGTPAVHLQVADSGPGIPADELEAVFVEFHRVQQQRVVAGTGLGLAIARRIVTRHGGRVWAESTVQVGSTFHLVLPAEVR